MENKDWLDFWQTYLSVVIAFMGICFAWKSSDKERKMHDNEMLAKDYEEHLTEEKNVLIEVCQSFDTDIIYRTFIELGEVNTKESKIILQNAREKVLDVQVKFELLTDIADSFQKCENCNFKPCYDRENMIALRDLYYKIENIYLQMIQKWHGCVEKIEQKQRREKIIQDSENLIILLRQRISCARENPSPGFLDNIKGWENEIFQISGEVKALKEQQIENEKIEEEISSITDTIQLISQELKPQIISYSKSYIEWKKRHKNELLQEGRIHYIKYQNCSKKQDSEN